MRIRHIATICVMAAGLGLSGCGSEQPKTQTLGTEKTIVTPQNTSGAVSQKAQDVQVSASGDGASKVMGTYNGKEITVAMVDRYWEPVLAHLRQRNGGNVPQNLLDQNRKQYFERILDEYAQVEEAERRGLKVDAGHGDLLVQSAKAKTGEEGFKKLLQDRNMSEEEFKAFQERTRLVAKLKQEVMPTLMPEDDPAVAAFYEQNKSRYTLPASVTVSLIQVKVASDAPAAEREKAEKKAKELLKKAKGKAQFADLAKENSDHPTASQGGKMTPFFKGRPGADKEILDAAFALGKPGDVSEVISTPNGFFILKLDTQNPETVRSLDDVKQQIVVQLRHQKYTEWVKELRTKAKVTSNF